MVMVVRVVGGKGRGKVTTKVDKRLVLEASGRRMEDEGGRWEERADR